MSKEQLLHKIEQKRNELVEIVLKHGFTATITIKVSQDLDNLLNQYNAGRTQKSLSWVPPPKS
ncbi:aspartyl-phosphate phosphatase Spo0E family protein [Bacillus sp. JJ1521]|uniref:aspartyl-phosphate phosphatase Spo0E family protein n=1 Tax=Bacillus sp. JJ1521 TaxID=3122957 RepID=UPI003000C961